MRPIPDAAAWTRLSALFDAGSELPVEMRGGWLESLGDDEPPVVVDWLRLMLAAAGTPDTIEALDRGPALPAWSDPVARDPAPGGAEATPPEKAPEDFADAAPPLSLPADHRAAPTTPGQLGPEASEPGDLQPGGPAPQQAPQASSSEPPLAGAAPRLAMPALSTGMRLGPWRLLGPMTSSDARVEQWRARRDDEEPAGAEMALLVPRQWQPRTDLGAWLAHGAARAIGLLHPHIARLTAVGVTDEGTPWIAAELAEGQPIDRWCREHPLGLPERRTLVEQALEAATVAHGRLVLHGHVNPSQIVLTPDGRLRFLNFGLSDLLDLLDTPKAIAHHGAGGPPPRGYVAPEQQLDATTSGPADPPGAATDIYALGLVAFEVLSGASPWQPRAPGAAVAAAQGSRWPRPSDVAGPPRLRRALRGDFDAIVVKATQSDPARRYASAAEFLDDLRRAGMHRPVTAVDGGFLYQLGRLSRRHPRLASIALVGATAFAVLLGGLSWRAWHWTTERSQAEAARRSSEAVARLTQDLLRENATPGLGRDWPELLARAEAVARSSLKGHPEGLASALAMLGRHQAERGAFAEARNLLAEAAPNLADPQAVLEASCDEAWAQARQGDKPDEAEQRVRRVAENVAAPSATRVLCMARLADLERRSGRPRDAYQTSLSAWRLWDSTSEKVPQLALLLARPMGSLSAALGRFHESQAWLEWTLKHLLVLKQDQGPLGIEVREQWTEVSLAAGDAERAARLADEILTAVAGGAFPADADPATAAPASMFLAAAEPRLELQRLAEARARLERAIALADARDDPPTRQRARCAMAGAALRERDASTAERWLKSAIAEATVGATQGATSATGSAKAGAGAGAGAIATSALAPSAQPAGVLGAAPASAAEEARNAARAAVRDADHACRATAIELALLQGRNAEALREAERLLNVDDELSPRLRAVVNLLRAEATLAARQHERALGAALQALQQARALHQSDIEDQKARPSFRSGQAAVVLAEAHRASGDIDEARKTLDYAMQQLSATLPESHPWRRRAEALKAALAVHATRKP